VYGSFPDQALSDQRRELESTGVNRPMRSLSRIEGDSNSGRVTAYPAELHFRGNFRIGGHTGGIDKAEILGTLKWTTLCPKLFRSRT
jgi:hypothetical protein